MFKRLLATLFIIIISAAAAYAQTDATTDAETETGSGSDAAGDADQQSNQPSAPVVENDPDKQEVPEEEAGKGSLEFNPDEDYQRHTAIRRKMYENISQEADEFSSPRNYIMSIKGGTYKPEYLRALWDRNDTPDVPEDDVSVDYNEIYPDEDQFLLFLDGAWTPITDWTTIGLGGGLGFTYAEGKALKRTAMGLEKTDNTVTFLLFPAYVGLFWNLDFYDQQPVVPSFNVGYDVWFYNETKEQGKGDETGWREGWHAAASLWLLLDWLEPEHAKRLDLDYGINHTYLVGEYRYSAINGFGITDGLDFSAHTFTGGLGFSF